MTGDCSAEMDETASSSRLLFPSSMKGESAVNNLRVVRSYSEEFMSSSEERERGFQFFGGVSSSSGSSAGGLSGKHRLTPYFDLDSLPTNVTVSEGSAFIHLPCRVKQLGDRTVS